MKLYIFFLILGTWMIASSCDNSLEVTAPDDFDVTTEKSTYRVGEEITFLFSGNPGIITFYSGEVGHDYEFREGRIIPPGEVSLSFENRVMYGNQPDQLSVLVSSDFSGQRNIDAILAATWQDITDRFTLTTGDEYVDAGTADLTDLVVDNRPLYLAYRYIYDPEQGAPRTWNIRNLDLKKTTPLGATTVATHLTGGFELFYVGPKEETGRSSVASGSITLRSNAAGNTDDYTEDWCVSAGFDFGEEDMGPDRPIRVKGYSDALQESMLYTYSMPGTYKVYFVGTNATLQEQQSIVRVLTIEIIP